MFHQRQRVAAAGVEQVAHVGDGDLAFFSNGLTNLCCHAVVIAFTKNYFGRDGHQIANLYQGIENLLANFGLAFLDRWWGVGGLRKAPHQRLDLGLLRVIEADLVAGARHPGAGLDQRAFGGQFFHHRVEDARRQFQAALEFLARHAAPQGEALVVSD